MGNLAQNSYATVHRCGEWLEGPTGSGLHKVTVAPRTGKAAVKSAELQFSAVEA
jgi:hypothetical protein